jgi:hypothetical protein
MNKQDYPIIGGLEEMIKAHGFKEIKERLEGDQSHDQHNVWISTFAKTGEKCGRIRVSFSFDR